MARKLTGKEILAQSQVDSDAEEEPVSDRSSCVSEDEEDVKSQSRSADRNVRKDTTQRSDRGRRSRSCSLDDPDAESQDTEMGSVEKARTPEHFQNKRRDVSPMLATSAEQGFPNFYDSVVNVLPFNEIRKSLNFEPSPKKRKRVTGDHEIGTSQVAVAKHRARSSTRESESEEEEDSSSKRQFFWMKPKEVREMMQNVIDPWADKKEALVQKYEQKFAEWHFMMRKGFSLMVHGVGSKKYLLDSFRVKELSLEPVLVIDGFKPECSLKSILTAFYTKMIGPDPPRSLPDTVRLVLEYIDEKYEHFNVIVHSMDGPSLRNSSSQQTLRKLAEGAHVHLLASIEHPNLPLLWNQQDLEGFNFLFYHCSTFADCDEYAIPDLISTNAVQASALVLESLRHVFESLTERAKRVYQEIAKYQLANEDQENAPTPNEDTGMPYNELYKRCREGFLVASEPILNKQLSEFYDHQLLKNNRGPDGMVYLNIPINKASLKKFLDSCE